VIKLRNLYVLACVKNNCMAHNADVEGDTNGISSSYECLSCGTRREGESHPGRCDCGGEFQNLAKSLE